jgi:hypothetical protein
MWCHHDPKNTSNYLLQKPICLDLSIMIQKSSISEKEQNLMVTLSYLYQLTKPISKMEILKKASIIRSWILKLCPKSHRPIQCYLDMKLKKNYRVKLHKRTQLKREPLIFTLKASIFSTFFNMQRSNHYKWNPKPIFGNRNSLKSVKKINPI